MKTLSIHASTAAAAMIMTITLTSVSLPSASSSSSLAAAATVAGLEERGALKAAKQATNEVFASCTEDDFLASAFEFTDTERNVTYSGNYTGCYTVAGTNSDDEELYVYSLTGNLTAGGAVFYASDNNGGLDEPIWYFTNAEADTAISELSSSGFLCYDIDLNPAVDTHPAEVTNWGVIPDSASSSTLTFTCDISIACGCSSDDDEEAQVGDDDDEAEEGVPTNAAFGDRGLSSSPPVAVAGAGGFLIAIFAASRL